MLANVISYRFNLYMISKIDKPDTTIFNHEGLKYHPRLAEGQALIADSVLPKDALFRLSAIGVVVQDPLSAEVIPADEDSDDFFYDIFYPKNRLFRTIFEDMLVNAQNQSEMRPETKEVLFGEMPIAVFDKNADQNSGFLHSSLDQVFYCRNDLSLAIMQKRAHEGKTITSKDFPSKAKRREEIMCKRLSFRTWKVLAKRLLPDAFTNVERYLEWEWRDRKTSGIYLTHIQQKEAGRIAVNSVVIADSEVLRIVEEAKDTGVVGLTKKSINTLEIMLSEQHPDLYTPQF